MQKSTRSARGALVLCLVTAGLGISFLEWNAYTGASRALLRLESAMQSEAGSPTRAEIESLLGRSGDGPVREVSGALVVDYSWRGVLYNHVLHAEYSLQPKSNPTLLSYSSQKVPRFPLNLSADSQDR
jgi:hypothetical protein